MWQLSGQEELTESPGFSRFISDYTQETAPGKENLEKDLSSNAEFPEEKRTRPKKDIAGGREAAVT